VPPTPDDRDLIRRCLKHTPGAWEEFVDRFLGLIYHVVRHTAHHRSVILHPEETEDLVADVLLHIISGDYALLQHFRGKSSLSTYLTVIARRVCVHALANRSARREIVPDQSLADTDMEKPTQARDLDDVEEVEKLLSKLPSREREVVRLRYLEGRSYEEISTRLRIPINTIGPILSRAKSKLRRKDGNGALRRKKKPQSKPKIPPEAKPEAKSEDKDREASV
jgi:RNA polymerase sigma-70 factor (ECF subfamily)